MVFGKLQNRIVITVVHKDLGFKSLGSEFHRFLKNDWFNQIDITN